MERTTGVSVCGYNIHSSNFEDVIWGFPPDRPGRLPKAMQVFMEQDATRLVFGTGASKSEDGKFEAQVMYEYLIYNFERLTEFDCLRGWCPPTASDFLNVVKERVEQEARLATECKNTAEEIDQAGAILEADGVTRWFVVSSPDHTPRVIKLINERAASRGYPWQNVAVASSVVPCGGGAEKVVVLESPNGASELYQAFLSEVGGVAALIRIGHSGSAELELAEKRLKHLTQRVKDARGFSARPRFG